MDTQNDAYENLSRAVGHMFTVEGLTAWLWFLIPLAFTALPLLLIRPPETPPATRIGKILLATLPVTWFIVWVIAIAFNNAGAAESEIAFWIFVGLGVVMLVMGIVAAALIKGWHRVTAAALLVVNLCIMVVLALLSVWGISGAS